MARKFLQFDNHDVVAAVQSLYFDQIRPFGRVVLKRLRERAAAQAAMKQGLRVGNIDPDSVPRIDPKRLRKVCESIRTMAIFPEDGREYSVRLTTLPDMFVDINSVDVYPPEMWIALAEYLRSAEGDALSLHGGRYECAKALAGKLIPCLDGRSLGQLCHIVQLAISQKRLLGYLRGHLVPYRYSEEYAKQLCASQQQPAAQFTLPLAGIEAAREGLRALFRSEHAANGIPVTSVKRLFRSVLCLELSETLLGHSKLHRLLASPWFHDVCRMEKRGSSQTILWPVEVLPRPVVPAARQQFVIPRLPLASDGYLDEAESPEASPQKVKAVRSVRFMPDGDGDESPNMSNIKTAELWDGWQVPASVIALGSKVECKAEALLSPGGSAWTTPLCSAANSVDVSPSPRKVPSEADTESSTVGCPSPGVEAGVAMCVKNTFIHVPAEGDVLEDGALPLVRPSASLPHHFKWEGRAATTACGGGDADVDAPPLGGARSSDRRQRRSQTCGAAGGVVLPDASDGGLDGVGALCQGEPGGAEA